ncbi:propanediol utilization microcompartment protein PduB, partial [Thermovenabulum sp.]
RSIGILGGRTGAGPQIMAADEAVKATNTEIISVELARDTKGGAGHGCLIIFGAEEVSDARRAIEVALKELPRTFGDVYANDAGHLEFQYTARASYAIEKAFGAPLGKAFGLIVGAPAAIGVVCCDTAVKAAEVDVVGYASPAKGTSFSNEAILFISGDSGAVRQALIAAREVGKKLLATLGEEPKSLGVPYI